MEKMSLSCTVNIEEFMLFFLIMYQQKKPEESYKHKMEDKNHLSSHHSEVAIKENSWYIFFQSFFHAFVYQSLSDQQYSLIIEIQQ